MHRLVGGRRAVGGALLGRIAEALDVDRAKLSGEADAALVAALQALAGPGEAAGQAAELARRFPAWARSIAQLARDRERDRDRIAALSDRLTHDPALADAMHELLTTVASVRSTAAILAQTPELERVWLDRFHGNLDSESRRLASGAEAVVSYFDRQGEAEAGLTPAEMAAAFLDAHRAPAGDEDAAAIAELPPAAREIAERHIARDREDAEALPDPPADRTPQAISLATGQPLSRVLRRLAACDPARGLAICDASGALLRRRPVAGFALPVIGAGCPLWPLYAALSRPLHPVSQPVETPDGAVWRAEACAEAVARTPHGPVLEATMLLTRDEGQGAALPVGPGCRVCPRGACVARREPALVTTLPGERATGLDRDGPWANTGPAHVTGGEAGHD